MDAVIRCHAVQSRGNIKLRNNALPSDDEATLENQIQQILLFLPVYFMTFHQSHNKMSNSDPVLFPNLTHFDSLEREACQP